MALRRHSLLVAVLCLGIVLLFQTLIVYFQHDGNWTALFYTGALYEMPPGLESANLYTFPNSYGYDGQLYHIIAHDPFFQHGLAEYVDDPRLRYRRILLPLLAYTLAGGQSNAIDISYLAIGWLFLLLGAYWLAECACLQGKSPNWGLLFLAMPAVIVWAERLVVDIALAAFAVGFAYYARQRPGWKFYGVLAGAALTRETGLIFIAASMSFALWRREWTTAVLSAVSALPCLAWYVFVSLHTEAVRYPVSFVPLSAIFRALTNPVDYPPHVPMQFLVQIGDGLALLGILAAFALAARAIERRSMGAVKIAAVLFAALGVFLQRDDNWIHVYDFGRVYTPLLVFLAVGWFRSGSTWLLLPVGLMLPRLGMQLGGQLLEVIRAATKS